LCALPLWVSISVCEQRSAVLSEVSGDQTPGEKMIVGHPLRDRNVLEGVTMLVANKCDF
jgi:hypothetical protein